MIWATVSSWSCFCWLYRASSSLTAKNIINLILVLTIWWCPCVESSLVLLKKEVKTTRPFRYDLNQIPYDYTVEVTNNFKGLDLIERVPEELWMKVSWHCTGGRNQDHPPKKKECKKAKWLSEETLQKAKKRREAKGKGKKERYTHLNAEFQRIARRDKKVYLSDQCKEIEENNTMGKTRLFKKIRDTKGTFHAKMA